MTDELPAGTPPTDYLLRYLWNGMKYRCYSTKCSAYHRYGGRGILVDTRWLGDTGFENYKLDMAGGWRPGLTIDRIDNDLGYSKDNCRWTTWLVQANNRHNTTHIEYLGEIKNVATWAKILNIPTSTLVRHLKFTSSISQVISNIYVTNQNKYNKTDKTVNEWAKELGISQTFLYGKLKSGLTLEDVTIELNEKRNSKVATTSEWATRLGMPRSTLQVRLAAGYTIDQLAKAKGVNIGEYL